MSKDYLSLGSVPCGEDCAMVGADDYRRRMRLEANAYIGQLRRMFPDCDEKNVRLVNKSFQHDMGTYHEVCAVFDDADEMAIEYAYAIESGLPEHWDTIAAIEKDGTLGEQIAHDIINGANSYYDRDNRLIVSQS